MKIKISPIVKVEQNGNKFFIGKLKCSFLRKCAISFTRNRPYDKKKYDTLSDIEDIIENPDISTEEAKFGTQRRENIDRLKEIGKYIEEAEGFFPNSIIVSVDPINKDLKDIDTLIKVDEINSYIEFDSDEVQLKLIDGQHRVKGFRFISDENISRISDNFEFVLTIFINLPYSDQADLFATINSTQKPVNKSILNDLKALNFEKYRRIHVCNAITKWFNEKEDKTHNLNVWKNNIKMLGVGEGIISQGTFVEVISRLITNDTEKRNGLLYNYYVKKEYEKIYLLLKDHFSAFEEMFKKEWINKDYILCKSIGFTAMISLFEVFYTHYNNIIKKDNPNLSFRDYVLSLLKKFKDKSYNQNFFTKKNYGSSLSDATKMKNDILTSIYGDTISKALISNVRAEKNRINNS